MKAETVRTDSTGESRIPIGRVLVVDGEALIRWSLAEGLSAAGYEVHEAGDGSETLAYFQADAAPFDLVLLDLELPDADGVSLLKRIRQICPGCRVILMTAFGAPDTLQEAQKAGVHTVAPKPFQLERMVEMVRRALA